MIKFQHKYNCDEALSIYLYDLIIRRKSPELFGFIDYQAFELTDILVDEYNQWADNPTDKQLWTDFLNNSQEKVEKFRKSFWVKFQPKVVLWSDRIKNEYFKSKLQQGFLFERFIYNMFVGNGVDLGEFNDSNGQYSGENQLGVEIKNDALIKKYGNIYIEYMEKSRAANSGFVNSGILKDDNTKYWLIGDYDEFFIFRKSTLLDIFNKESANAKAGRHSELGVLFKEIETSKGFVIPKRNAKPFTISFNCLIDELKHNETERVV